MKTISKIVAPTVIGLVLLSAFAEAQDAKAPINNPNQQTAPAPSVGPVADPFQPLLDRARQAQAGWATKDDTLDEALAARGACDPGAQADLKETLEAKRGEINAWTDYYSKHLEYNRDRAKATSGAVNTRGPQRSDLVNAIGIEERELGDLKRRLSDLDQTLKEKNETGNTKALDSLRDMTASKDQGLQKLRRALELFDHGSHDLAEMRDLAMKRIGDVQALLNGLRIESTLYENLYGGMTHRIDLKCDKATPSASPRGDDDWLKRTGDRIKKD
jgi:hypothetical protein